MVNGVSNMLLQKTGITTFILNYKSSMKRIIGEIPEDMSITKLKSIMEEENFNVVITSLFRLKRCNRLTRVLEESESVCIEVNSEVRPRRISIFKAIIAVKPYVQSFRLCFNCGHISKFCEKQDTCFTCAGDHRLSRENPCQVEKRCFNCGGPHSRIISIVRINYRTREHFPIKHGPYCTRTLLHTNSITQGPD